TETAIGFRHVRIDVEERDALAIDRNFDLLVLTSAPNQPTIRCGLEFHIENVLAVSGEVVDDGDATTGSHGCAIGMPQLICCARERVRCRRRSRLWIPETIDCDLIRRANISFKNCRRERLSFGDVVEAVMQAVGWKKGGDIDIDAEQIVNGSRVLSLAES